MDRDDLRKILLEVRRGSLGVSAMADDGSGWPPDAKKAARRPREGRRTAFAQPAQPQLGQGLVPRCSILPARSRPRRLIW